MTVLGVVLRARPEDRLDVGARASALPGVTLGADPGDGRLVLVIEDGDAPGAPTAAATLAALATWAEVLNVSLVYEYSGPDSPAPEAAVTDYRAWRGSLAAPASAPTG